MVAFINRKVAHFGISPFLGELYCRMQATVSAYKVRLLIKINFVQLRRSQHELHTREGNTKRILKVTSF